MSDPLGPHALSKADLIAFGFEGFIPIRTLSSERRQTPRGAGVYVVLHVSPTSPRFLTRSPAGRFKGRDPTVPIATLAAKWVSGAELVYVGKAPLNALGRRGLDVRVAELLAFGAGAPVAHWGGRYLWQLAESAALEVGWKLTTDPKGVENQILSAFHAAFGCYPFANIAGPRR